MPSLADASRCKDDGCEQMRLTVRAAFPTSGSFPRALAGGLEELDQQEGDVVEQDVGTAGPAISQAGNEGVGLLLGR